MVFESLANETWDTELPPSYLVDLPYQLPNSILFKKRKITLTYRNRGKSFLKAKINSKNIMPVIAKLHFENNSNRKARKTENA